MKSYTEQLKFNNPKIFLPLFELDTGSETLYLTPHSEILVINGQSYQPFPCQREETTEVSSGDIPTCRTVWSDITGTLSDRLKSSGSIDGEKAVYKLAIIPNVWLPNTTYSAGDKVYGSSMEDSSVFYTARIYKCTTPGTSAAKEPAWNTGIGLTTADNSVVWTEDSVDPVNNILFSETLEIIKCYGLTDEQIVLDLGIFNPYEAQLLQEKYLKNFCWNVYKGEGCWIKQPPPTVPAYTAPNGCNFANACRKNLVDCMSADKLNTARFDAYPALSAVGGKFV